MHSARKRGFLSARHRQHITRASAAQCCNAVARLPAAAAQLRFDELIRYLQQWVSRCLSPAVWLWFALADDDDDEFTSRV